MLRKWAADDCDINVWLGHGRMRMFDGGVKAAAHASQMASQRQEIKAAAAR